MHYKTVPNNTHCNTVNIRSYEPYASTSEGFVVHSYWWNTLNSVAKSQISKLDPKITNMEFPHSTTEDKTHEEAVAYIAYVESFDYQHWSYLTSSTLILIPPDMKKKLASANISGFIHPELTGWIQNISLPFDTCFAKLSGTSGKNEKRVKPIRTLEDLTTFLCGGNLILVSREFAVENKDTYLIFSEWKDLDNRNEFRVFCRNKKIIGASQQFTGHYFHYTQDEIEQFLKAFEEMNLNSIPYFEYTLDVYFGNEEMNLIEINPFGAHSGCGSSLFEWERY